MNTATATKPDPEERTFLCNDELIRFIKKHRRVCVHLRTEAGSTATTQVNTKEILADIERGDFEAFTFYTYGRTVWINDEAAPIWLEMRRRIARLTKRIAWAESRITAIKASAFATEAYNVSTLATLQRDIESDQRTIAHAQAYLAQRASQPAVAA
ncbi:MAG: hypothetical protein V4773_27705 [Verrucomicrobiota bacterium]